MKLSGPHLTLCCYIFAMMYYGQVLAQENSYFTNSIIHTTSLADDQEVMHQAAKVAELEDMLDNEGPFTVFVPTDHAFRSLPEAQMEKWLRPENREQLSALVSYHIIAGKISAAQLLKKLSRGEGKTTLTTLQGEAITATMEGIDIVLTDLHGNKARIIKADNNQCNGVVHTIDSVIRPSRM